jgi:hypothetical protein
MRVVSPISLGAAKRREQLAVLHASLIAIGSVASVAAAQPYLTR